MVVGPTETATVPGSATFKTSLAAFGALALALAALYAVATLTAPDGGGLWTGPSLDTLSMWGAKVDRLVAEGQWERLVLGSWLHVDAAHLATNLLWTLVFGAVAGRLGGAGLAIATWVLAAAGGQLASFLTQAGTSVGASGAVYGMAGLMAAWVYRLRGQLPTRLRRRALLAVGLLVAALLVAPLTMEGVDHAAHIGGVLAGVAIGSTIRGARGARRLMWATALLAVAAVALRVARVL